MDDAQCVVALEETHDGWVYTCLGHGYESTPMGHDRAEQFALMHVGADDVAALAGVIPLDR